MPLDYERRGIPEASYFKGTANQPTKTLENSPFPHLKIIRLVGVNITFLLLLHCNWHYCGLASIQQNKKWCSLNLTVQPSCLLILPFFQASPVFTSPSSFSTLLMSPPRLVSAGAYRTSYTFIWNLDILCFTRGKNKIFLFTHSDGVHPPRLRQHAGPEAGPPLRPREAPAALGEGGQRQQDHPPLRQRRHPGNTGH